MNRIVRHSGFSALGTVLALGATACARHGETTPATVMASARAPRLECVVPTWRMVFQNDAEGRDAGGSREALVLALRRGSPLRVAWGDRVPAGSSVVEFAEVGFTSLMNDRDLVVQFEDALIQTDYLDPKLAALRSPPLVWRGLMSTDGRFDALILDAAADTVVRRLTQRAAMTWYALAPDPGCDDRPAPDLAIPGAIRLDSTPPPAQRPAVRR